MFPSLLLTLALLAPAPEAKPLPATNTLCPVMGKAVNEKSKTVVVRGREYRICCRMCSGKLQKDPDKYLDKNGELKNEKK